MASQRACPYARSDLFHVQCNEADQGLIVWLQGVAEKTTYNTPSADVQSFEPSSKRTNRSLTSGQTRTGPSSDQSHKTDGPTILMAGISLSDAPPRQASSADSFSDLALSSPIAINRLASGTVMPLHLVFPTQTLPFGIPFPWRRSALLSPASYSAGISTDYPFEYRDHFIFPSAIGSRLGIGRRNTWAQVNRNSFKNAQPTLNVGLDPRLLAEFREAVTLQ